VVRGLVVVWFLLQAGVARADDAVELHEQALFDKSTDPLLHLDPIARPSLTGLGTREDVHERTMMQLGDRTWLELEGMHWTNQEKDQRVTNDETTPERGFSTGIRLSHDLGPFQVSLLARLGEVDSQQSLLAQRLGGDQRPFAPARYADVGVTIGKSKKLSRWMTAWIALTAGYRTWLGEPPPGEEDGGQAMLTIGTTFR